MIELAISPHYDLVFEYCHDRLYLLFFFFFQAEDGIRDLTVTGVQTCALPISKRTGFGREMIAGQWAAAEFAALYRLWEVGVQLGVRVVPYPVQILGTELLLEFLGTADGEAAPRLAQLRPDGAELTDLWHQAVEALVVLARCGLAHGDLSPYNILVDDR